jgi:hypothetical protein
MLLSRCVFNEALSGTVQVKFRENALLANFREFGLGEVREYIPSPIMLILGNPGQTGSQSARHIGVLSLAEKAGR